ncbi:MAG: cell wall hydrolase [Clostridia bacterium]|nr:cell wall hydrolase [Clostridia bacterium]
MNQISSRRTARLALFLAVSLLLGVVGIIGAAAAPALPAGSQTTRVYLDGEEILAGECALINSVTYVPLRKFCYLFDECDVSWNGATNTATVKTDDLTIYAQTGALYITANGHYFYTVQEILNLGGTLYVPIRPLTRAFNATLSWNADTRSTEVTSPVGTPAVAWASYDSDDVYWLSRIISAESGGEPFRGQIAVGNVVLNRLKDPAYPNTVYGVIFDRKHGTQFSPVSSGSIYRKPTASATIAAKICLEGYTLSDEILFFYNPRIATSHWIDRARTYQFTIGNHKFYS